MLQISVYIQTHAYSIASERTQSSMIEIITPQSERSDSKHLSSASNPSTSMSLEYSMEIEI